MRLLFQNSVVKKTNIIFLVFFFIAKTLCAEEQLFGILISTSQYWFNFRQGANSILIYEAMRANGVPDENILLMIPENIACNAKNNEPGNVSPFDDSKEPNLYQNVQVDYQSNDASKSRIIDTIRGRYSRYTPRGQKIQLNKNSRLLLFLNGHGGDSYIKVQDTDYILDTQFHEAVSELHYKNLYKESLFISDSCSASTLFYQLTNETTPNIISIGSSSYDEKSLSHGRDKHLQGSQTDRFSFQAYKFLKEDFDRNRKLTIKDLLSKMTYEYLSSHYEIISTNLQKTVANTYVKDFFSNQRKPSQIHKKYYEDENKLNREPSDILKTDILKSIQNLKVSSNINDAELILPKRDTQLIEIQFNK